MTEQQINELKDTAFRVRQSIIKMATGGGCFIGASLSCVEILVYLYKKYLNINLENLKSDDRDYFFLSKGHDVPALYGVFSEIGFINKERLENHLKPEDNIYWHPNTTISGVEFHSGSLGHLLSVGIGVALDCKLKNMNNKVVVLLGDGELNEGTIWEGLLTANAYKLNNLILIIDRNGFQANVQTEHLIPLESLREKFLAFGAYPRLIDGHDFAELENALTQYIFDDRVRVIIADTVRGKGLPSIENRADRWFCNFTEKEIESLLNELEGVQRAELVSDVLIVR